VPASRGDTHCDAFWRAVRSRSASALAAGALEPIPSHVEYLDDGGIEFVVRVTDNLARKHNAPSAYRRAGDSNPFQCPDAALTICELPTPHLAILNKFNVLPDHVLVVTREFVHQESPLEAVDFAAVAPGLAGGAGLAFYNAGTTAGASQPHKHFQLVPLPLGRGPSFPTAPVVDDAPDGVDTVRVLRLRHARYRIDAPAAAPADFGMRCHAVYRRALEELGLEPLTGSAPRLPPYNLLLTNRWMLLVPRVHEHFRDISVNGLGFAGCLAVSSEERLERLRTAGPLTVLESVATPSR